MNVCFFTKRVTIRLVAFFMRTLIELLPGRQLKVMESGMLEILSNTLYDKLRMAEWCRGRNSIA